MILMNDFQEEYKMFRPELMKALENCLGSGRYILGENVLKFEKNFAKYVGTKYCVGVANGLEALQISLMVLGIGKGDEVITVSNTAVATALAISNVSAKPVFVDIDDYFHIDTRKIEEKITPKTRAIIPVHLFGQMVDMQNLKRLAKKHHLKIVEDACQAHGATFNSKKAGSFGDLGCFSFYPTKNLGAYGDGGAITTNSKKFYEKCAMLRNYGQKNRYEHLFKGLNSRLDELQAAILNVKLRKIERLIKKRQKIANLYFQNLTGVKQIVLPKIRKNYSHTFHLFVIQAEDRDKLQNFLRENKIESLIHYPIPIHKQRCYKDEYPKLVLEKIESVARKILSLPIHPLMTDEEVLTICQVIKKFYANG